MSEQDGEVELFSAGAQIVSEDKSLNENLVFIVEIIPTKNLSVLLDKAIPLPDTGPSPGS